MNIRLGADLVLVWISEPYLWLGGPVGDPEILILGP